MPILINCSILQKEYRLERFYQKVLGYYPIIPGIDTLAQNLHHIGWNDLAISEYSKWGKAYGIRDLKQHLKELKDHIEYEKRQLEIIIEDKKKYISTDQVNKFLDYHFNFKMTEKQKTRALLLFYNFCLGDNSIWSDLVLWESNHLKPNRGNRSKEFSSNQEIVYKMAMVGLTQKQIAKKTEMSQQMVSKHWRRARNKSKEFYKKLLATDPNVKDAIDIQDEIFRKKERANFFVSNTWHLEYKTEPNVEVPMTSEEIELEKQTVEFLEKAKNSN